MTTNAPHPQDDPRYEVHKTDAEWREQLDPMQYQVARHAATERPFSGKYWDHWQQGHYNCIGCGTPLFDAQTKFDAGCGWPSFSEAIPGAIRSLRDVSHGMVRTETVCAQCGAHLGHVFPDGPTDTGLRYCMNSASLDFQSEGNKT